MIIESIRIQNFRGIDLLELPCLDEHVNLFVGINGAGKTTVLDALGYFFSWFLARLKNAKGQGSIIADSDIKNGSRTGCKISITVKDAGEWVLYRSKGYGKRKEEEGKTDLSEMMSFIDRIKEGVDLHVGVPVVMYYPVDRAINTVPIHLKRSVRTAEIWDVYENALKGNTEFRSFFEWYRKQEDAENEHIRDDRDYRDPSLSAIRRAISLFFPDFGELRVRRNPQRFVINKGEEVVEFNQLSQGEKCYLALVCDLARRFSIANPHLENPLEGQGVVMIDEVDLHLHPKWQMEIVSKLHSIFPNCQFFLSSHSPQVLSDLTGNQIVALEDGHKVDIDFNPLGKLASDILANYFDVPMARNSIVVQKIEKAYNMIREGRKDDFLDLFDQLTALLGKADPDVVNLKIESVRNFR